MLKLVAYFRHHLQNFKFVPHSRQYFSQYFADMSPNADIQISALKMFADSRYADIDIADADINIGTSLIFCHPWT